MTDSNEPNDAVWYWRTDQGNWHAYPKELQGKIEEAWKNGVTRLPVDAERFVNTVKMEQRRLDMTGKPRSIKRELVLALERYIFGVAKHVKKDPVPLISKHGGVATYYITKKVCLQIYLIVALFFNNPLTSSKNDRYILLCVRTLNKTTMTSWLPKK